MPQLSLPQSAQLFKTLGDEVRLRLLLLLSEHGPMSVSALCAATGQAQTTVSHHLMLMRVASLVGYRRLGKNNFYFITSDYALELLRRITRGELKEPTSRPSASLSAYAVSSTLPPPGLSDYEPRHDANSRSGMSDAAS